MIKSQKSVYYKYKKVGLYDERGQRMKFLKWTDRCISGIGILLFGILTGFSLFYTVYFTTQYEEIPYEK